ncbi:hypothetical protein jhhlp_002664 [Lomentospora prolificans]|uniref:Uncharacterized protein n=1 Tax=Lomentospora prolificans TaxID=41688 RepID=A0A2N3NEK2_9PEZI|nr:hypothetical protein jhhlp_002664 [Lomentospora prolificans]
MSVMLILIVAYLSSENYAVLKNTDTPAMSLQDLPVVDAILLSDDDHPDNLDEFGRRLLDGRRALTTMGGVSKLAPRPGVRGIRPWETVDLHVNGHQFQVTATPRDHLPGGECTGFIITASEFGKIDLVQLANKFHVSVALRNGGAAQVPLGDPPLRVTMNGK